MDNLDAIFILEDAFGPVLSLYHAAIEFDGDPFPGESECGKETVDGESRVD